MALDWESIRTGAADALHGTVVELEGWAIALDPDAMLADYCLLLAEPPCCGGCVPRDPYMAVEVRAATAMALSAGPMTVRGRLVRLHDDPAGWRFRLEAAEATATEIDADLLVRVGRRAMLMSGLALGLAACAGQPLARRDQGGAEAGPVWHPEPGVLTIDMHSHAGRVIVSRTVGDRRPFLPLAAPMQEGGLHLVCLAIVTDTTVTRISADHRRFEAWGTPQPGELYALGQTEFARVHRLIEREGMPVVTDKASLAAQGGKGPAAIIAAEGGDFLEGRIERVDEAYAQHQLRHLQLTHYRVNELGDIQTAPPVHGGLTDFGADVVRRCNALGIVVDIAHGTYDLVVRAAQVTTKPLVLSHTALVARPGPYSRVIDARHARVVADTGGVVGVWPSAGSFRDLQAMAEGVARMADAIGIDHVGVGTDMLGFLVPPVFDSYTQLPELASALRGAGLSDPDVGKVLGGNYRRVFEASVG